MLYCECTNCRSEMVVRVSKKGLNPGRSFLGCSGFPGCKIVIDIDINVTPHEIIHNIICNYQLRNGCSYLSIKEYFDDIHKVLNNPRLDQLCLWILQEMAKYNPHDMHNHLLVGSPYCFLLAKFYRSIKSELSGIEIDKMINNFLKSQENNKCFDEWIRLIDEVP